MIRRVMEDDRARRAARLARVCYAVFSAVWMAAMFAFGVYLVVKAWR